MIGVLLQDPTIDKLNFRVPPGMYDLSTKAIKLFEDNTTGGNTDFKKIYNDPDKHIYACLSASGLKIDSNPNNIGDPLEIQKAYKDIGIELSDCYNWAASVVHIERNKQLGGGASEYVPVLASSVNPRNITYVFNKQTFSIFAGGKRRLIELQFYDKTNEMKSKKGIHIPPNICRLEVRFKTPPLVKLGIRTVADLYEIGPSGWLSIYRDQFDKLLPSIRKFAGEDSDGAILQNNFDELVNVFDASFIYNQSKEKGKRGRNVVITALIDVAFRSGDIGSLGSYDQLENAYLIASSKHKVDRRVKSYDLKILKQEYMNFRERQRWAGSFMQQTAREILTYVA
jgi:hypothetical protein